MIDKLIAKTFRTRDAAHLAHWAAKGEGSDAKHRTLGDFYEALIDKVDGLDLAELERLVGLPIQP